MLREMNYGEADRILTLLSPSGKISALAKGIRRATSRKVGHLGLFYQARVLLARGRNLDIVTQAESLQEFEGIRHDLLRFTYACYAAELIGRFAQEEEESPALYELMVQGLHWFSEEANLRLWMRYFELRLLGYSGYQPQLFSCADCHGQIRPEANRFSNERGGLLCPRCSQDDQEATPLSIGAQKVLRYLQWHGSDDVRCLRVRAATQAELENLLQNYLEYTLERKLESVAFLRHLRRQLQGIEQ